MPDFGTIQPIDLTTDRKRELEAQMALARDVLQDAAYAICMSDNPSDIRRIRDEHLQNAGTINDPLRRYAGAVKCINGIQVIAEEVIAGYIRTVHKMCLSFELSSGIDYDDCLQVAAWAIYDVMFVYNGRTQFTTFVYSAVKNSLTNLVRQNDKTGARIRQLKTLVKAAMKSGMEFDHALEYVSREENLEPAIASRLQRSMAMTRPIGEEEEIASEDRDVVDAEETQRMWDAVHNANLTDIERELLEAHLNGDKGFRGRLEKERVNPTTGKLYTRQCLGQTFAKVRAKLVAYYNNPIKKQVAA